MIPWCMLLTWFPIIGSFVTSFTFLLLSKHAHARTCLLNCKYTIESIPPTNWVDKKFSNFYKLFIVSFDFKAKMSDNFTPSTSSAETNSTTMTTSFSASAANEIPADCKLAEIAVQDVEYNWIRIAHIVCGLIITFLLFKIVQQAHRVRVPLHGNLKVKLRNLFKNFLIFF